MRVNRARPGLKLQHMVTDNYKREAPVELTRQLDHACRELKMTPEQIANMFHVSVDHIEAEHIAKLWRQKLSGRG